MRLTVVDVAGRVVARPLAGAALSAGTHVIQIDGAEWSAGTYLVRMDAAAADGLVSASSTLVKAGRGN